MRMPGPFEIHKVVDLDRHVQAPEFILRGVTPSAFRATRTAADARFTDPATASPILSFHSYLVRSPAGTLLVDTCVGNHKERPGIAEWHLREGDYLARLAAAGVAPEAVDFVCCTHLHADHFGWNTRLEDGRWVPTFPNARYLFAADEVAYWEAFHRLEPGNLYEPGWVDSVLPVMEAGLVERVRGDHEIAPGIRLRPAPGHTPGNVVIELDDGRLRAVMSGDVIHHPVQIERWQWSSQFCLDPDAARVQRHALLERIAGTGTVLLAAHFAGPTAVRVLPEGDAFFYETLEGKRRPTVRRRRPAPKTRGSDGRKR
jgi:glyoxylase-like metal-dependent hydrolase (beta-lactamase superfamily II)